MTSMRHLVDEIDRLPAAEKWRLVKHMLDTLEQEQAIPTTREAYLQRLRETYGVLRDTPIERADQGEYEGRELLE